MENTSINNKIIKALLPKFLENIDEKDKEFMESKFIEYFNEKYKYINENDFISEKAKDLFVFSVTNQEISRWQNFTLEQKKSLIIPDLNLEKLFCLSNKTFSMARNRLESNKQISETEYNETKIELNKTYEQIEPYNKESAKMTLSESLLDLDYAVGNTTDITSLRLGREIRLKNNVKH